MKPFNSTEEEEEEDKLYCVGCGAMLTEKDLRSSSGLWCQRCLKEDDDRYVEYDEDEYRG